MSTSFTLRQRLRYRIDNTLARGVGMVLLWLGILTALFVGLIAFLIWISRIGPGDQSTPFSEGIWYAITRSLDPGTFSGDGEGGGTKFRFVMFMVTVIGIFLGATIIGVISSGIDTRLERLRRGKSAVVESGQTLIIGGGDKLNTIISELVEANRSERNRAIVVLTPDDPVDVTDDIRRDVKDLGTSRLVVRNGNPTRINDLALVNPQNARSVIVLCPEGEGSQAYMVKVLLGLNQLLPEGCPTTVVAEMEDPEVAVALKEVVGSRLITVVASNIVARITAQVSRTAGLGSVYQELLDFDGDEMYSVDIPDRLIGMSFGQLTMASSRATIIGISRVDGSVMVNPDPLTVLAVGDRAIGIAADDSVFVLDLDPAPWSIPADHRDVPLAVRRERTLIIGWSGIAALIVKEIENHVAMDSELVALVDEANHEPLDVMQRLQAMDLVKQTVKVRTGSTISRSVLAETLAAGPFEHIMILCERGHYDVDNADARVLLTLMHVRAIDPGNARNVIVELVDPNDVELGRQGDSDEFIVSQQLISLLLTQLSESPRLEPVFTDLFDGEGASIAMHPIERYLPLGTTDFGSVVAEVRNWGAVAIGYRAASAQTNPDCLPGGIRVNPPKSEVIDFSSGDTVVLLVKAQ